MFGDTPWLFLSERSLLSLAAGIVLAYLSLHLQFTRRASSATRALAWMLMASAVNMSANGLWRAAYDPEIATVAYAFARLSVTVVPIFMAWFVYAFARDLWPRERRAAIAIVGVVLLPSLARGLFTSFAGTPVYSPLDARYFLFLADADMERAGTVPDQYPLYASMAVYAWSLVVLARKCVALERGHVDPRRGVLALIVPRRREARGVRDFAALAVGLVGMQLLPVIGGEEYVSFATLCLSCGVVWVHVNHSSEPTRLRFKLVAIPLVVVVGLLTTALRPIVANEIRVANERRDTEVARIRNAVEAARSSGGEPVLTEADVGPGVRFVLARPISDGAYGRNFTALYSTPGIDVDRLAEAEAAEEAWLVGSYVRSDASADPSLPRAERVRDMRESFRDGRRHRWSITGSALFMGALGPADQQFVVGWWKDDDGLLYHVGWNEFDRRADLGRLPDGLGMATLGLALAMILGLPLLFRASVLGPITRLLEGVRRVEGGDLNVTVPAGPRDEFGLLARAFNAMVASIREARDGLERTNRAAFRFVPRPFLKTLGHESILTVDLGDQSRRTMTVLFADVRDFTAHSEKMTPGETFEFVNALLRRVGPAIRSRGGFIDKYLGDAVMALFDDASGAGPDAAFHAALDMQASVAELNATRAEVGATPVRLGIGLHRGELMLGVIGEEERIDTTVLADAVNTASRIEGLTKTHGASILVSGDTLAALDSPEAFETRFVERSLVKGRAAPVDVHELVGARS